jgi:hypothetical protein
MAYCSVCGTQMSFYQQHNRWYCPYCRNYTRPQEYHERSDYVQPQQKGSKKQSIMVIGVVIIVIIIIFGIISINLVNKNNNGDKNGNGKPQEKNGNGKPQEKPNTELVVGDTWYVKSVDEDGVIMTMDTTVTNTSFFYKGIETSVIEVKYYIDDWVGDDSGTEFDFVSGTGVGYLEKEHNNMIYLKGIMNFKIRYSGEIEWIDVRMESETDYQRTGKIPDEYAIGNTWSITEREISEDRTFWNDEVLSKDNDDETQTLNFEVLGKKNVTVEAGTFECFETRFDVIEDNTYTLEYYSPEVKMDIKSVKYNGTNIISMIELISYSVS